MMKQFTNRKVKHIRFTIGIQLIGVVKTSLDANVGPDNADMEL